VRRDLFGGLGIGSIGWVGRSGDLVVGESSIRRRLGPSDVLRMEPRRSAFTCGFPDDRVGASEGPRRLARALGRSHAPSDGSVRGDGGDLDGIDDSGEPNGEAPSFLRRNTGLDLTHLDLTHLDLTPHQPTVQLYRTALAPFRPCLLTLFTGHVFTATERRPGHVPVVSWPCLRSNRERHPPSGTHANTHNPQLAGPAPTPRPTPLRPAHLSADRRRPAPLPLPI